jgi:hypothetical protein
MRPENCGPVSQQVWHGIKDLSLLKGPERGTQVYSLQSFTVNSYISIWVNYSRAEGKTINNQSIFVMRSGLMDLWDITLKTASRKC